MSNITKPVMLDDTGKSVAQALGNVATAINNLEKVQWGQVKGALSNQTDLNNNLNSLQSQIDSFTALSDGSTTGDAELTNIRVDSAGHTYSTAGDAVRAIDAQVRDMKTGFDGVVYNSPAEQVIGSDTKLQGEIDGITDMMGDVLNVVKHEFKNSYNVTANKAILNNVHIFDVSIPTGKKYTFRINDTEDHLSGGFSLYENGTNIANNLSYDRTYEFVAGTNITYLSVYIAKAGVISSGTIEFVLEVIDENNNSIQSKIERIYPDFEQIVVASSNIEQGKLIDNTGAEAPATNRARTAIYVPVVAGTVVKCSSVINVFEYAISDKSYIRDNNAWTTSYTVQNNCFIRIMWNNEGGYTFQQLANNTTISCYRLKTAALDLNDPFFAKSEEAVDIRSVTVKTIGHRGDDIIAPECTRPSYIAARKRGIQIMENDLNLSEDGQFVMWHDSSFYKLGNMVDINGYKMYADVNSNYYWVDESNNVYTYENGEYVASAVPLENLSRCSGSDYSVNSSGGKIGLDYAVLKRIDVGLYKGQEFQGTQILSFEEWVVLCKELGAEIYIDRKLTYTDFLITSAAGIVKKYGMGKYSSWLGLDPAQITLLRNTIPDARCGRLNHPTAALIEQYAPYNTGRGFFFNGDAKNGMTAEAIQLGINAGFDVEVWYVDFTNNQNDVLDVLQTAISYGVTGITTDHYRAEDVIDRILNS